MENRNDIQRFISKGDSQRFISKGDSAWISWAFRALECLSEAYSGLSVFIDMPHSPLNETKSHLAPIIATGAIGRPRFEIACGQLQCLIDNRFSVPQIAKLLSVSVSTIRRRMLDFNLCLSATYSTIADDALDELVCSVQNQYPYWGNRVYLWLSHISRYYVECSIFECVNPNAELTLQS